MKRFGIPLGLAVLAGVCAEFLLGDQYLNGTMNPAGQVVEVVLFTVFYGSAAVIIREVTRRSHRGWPTILLLALGFGLLEEGVLTQTLFNPHYLGFDLLSYGRLPVIGTALPWLLFVIALHVVWSISSPIAVMEALFPNHARPGGEPGGPWLRPYALIVPVVLFLLGAAGTAAVSFAAGHFLAQWWQLALALVAAGLAVVAAFTLTPAQVPGAARLSPQPIWFAAVIGFALSSAYHLVGHRQAWPAPVTVALQLLLIAAVIVLAYRFRLSPFGLAAGALGTYGWVGLNAARAAGSAALAEQIVIVVLVASVVVLAWRRFARIQDELRLAATADLAGHLPPWLRSGSTP